MEKIARAAARPLARLGLQSGSDRLATRAVARSSRVAIADAFFREKKPAAVLVMCPFLPVQCGIAAEARRKGIPTAAFITSWDNISTKGRLPDIFDAYCVWSEDMRRELHEFYSWTTRRPVYVVGAPQYEAMSDARFVLDRETYFRRERLDPSRKLVLYCLGSPNLIREDYGALELVRRMAAHPHLAAAQVVVRLHPGFSEIPSNALEAIRSGFPQVVIQSPHRHWDIRPTQTDDAVVEWVNTIRHADVVINLASTITVDAAILDRPVINLDFDPEPGSPNAELVHDINHRWVHFRPITLSGGAATVQNYDELLNAITTYLHQPENDRAKRAWVARHVCGVDNAPPGHRLAEAVRAIMNQ